MMMISMSGLPHLEPDYSEFVEVDPTGRYGRYNEILGKGASKTVYRAFDEYEGIEVAWNQVKLYDFLQSPQDLERLYCEIHLLKTLKHPNIMKFYTSWVDTSKRNINFVTEMFTSGTLKQYREKHKRVNIRAVKHWCRQILGGLLYLHSHDPPVIHRDLKCDNIFINGNQGQVKIGDLGLAAILRKSHAAHCVGTPEFMAPEVYAEEYNELVDIYSFGMCILEMVTFEYPYSECSHPAQIYKKVISGKKPDALYKVRDPEVRQFVEKCLATVSLRLSAEELLDDPFLRVDDCESELRLKECRRELGYMQRQPYLELEYEGNSVNTNGYSNGVTFDAPQNLWDYHSTDIEQSGIELFDYNDEEHDEHSANVDITIKGKKREDGSIFLRLRISDRDGHIRNIYFPFDIESDTALSVATEMVGELDITDQDVTNIADMIDGEIASLVPDWKSGPGIEETPRFANLGFCFNCASNHTSTCSFMNFLSNDPGAKNLLISQCAGNGCAAMHGRFEEITYQQQVDDDEHPGGACASGSQINGFHYPEIWDHLESLECSSQEEGDARHDDDDDELDRVKKNKQEEEEAPPPEEEVDDQHKALEKSLSDSSLNLMKTNPSLSNDDRRHHESDDYEQEIQQELRWLRAKYQMELRKLRDQQLGITAAAALKVGSSNLLLGRNSDEEEKSSSNRPDSGTQRCEEAAVSSCCCCKLPNGGEEDMVVVTTAKSFYTGGVVPRSSSLHRTTSLLVDAVDL